MSECLKDYFVSIDVGMKNLAFCLFKCEPSVARPSSQIRI